MAPEWRCPACGQGFTRRNQRHSCTTQSPEAFLAPYPEAAALYPPIWRALRNLGEVEVAASKTQISFRRSGSTRFAWLWIPQMALRRGPPDLYLAFDLPHRATSPRIKEATQVGPDRWVHHARLADRSDLDTQLVDWLRQAYEAAA